MGELFNLNNKFFRAFNKVIDSVALSVLWMICFIPLGINLYFAISMKAVILLIPCIITIIPTGAATTAMYYAMNKVIRHERGYVWGEFWHSFRSNFKQTAYASMIMGALAVVLAGDTYIMYQLAKSGKGVGALVIVFIILLVLLTMWGIYIFPYIARFENTTKQMLKNAGLIALANLPKTLMMFILLAAILVITYALPVIGIVMPAVYIYSVNLLLEKIFRKYMSEEDLAAEDERNRDDFN